MESTCKNCQERIVKVNFALGESWMHQREGASGTDGQYMHCRLSVAEPIRQPKRCLNFTIHPAHEWVFTHPAQRIFDQLCWCEGATFDIRKGPI